MNLERRIERLEEKLGAKSEPRVLVITNVRFDHTDGQPPSLIQFVPEVWAFAVRGGPFTREEINQLRNEHAAANRQA